MMGVFDDLDRELVAALVRMLDIDPALTKEDALARLRRVADDGGLSEADARVAALGSRVARHAVLSPLWLKEKGLHTYGFLANVRPGMLKQSIRQSEQRRAGVSHYSVYGTWDSVLLLNGTAAEANQLQASLHAGTDDEPTQFMVEDVVLTYRRMVHDVRGQRASVPLETANALVDDFDDAASAEVRDGLLSSNHILGSTWAPVNFELFPVEAFVGLSLRSRSNVRPNELLELFMRHEVLQQSLVHFFRVSQGLPFHYFLKLCCLDMRELDDATIAIGATSRGDVRFESHTMVVASGTYELPMFRNADVSDLPLGPDLTSMVQAAERVFARLPTDHQVAFNQLDEDRQITVVKSLAQLGDRLDAATVSATTRARLESALSTFSRECIINSAQPNLTGAATEVAATFEGDLKRLLLRLALAVYGKDMGRFQSELKLPGRTVHKLPLGKVAHAIRAACEHSDFGDLAGDFHDAWLERVDRFVDTRNRWAHDAVQHDIQATQLIDEAYRTVMEAIELSDWIETRLASLNALSQGGAEADSEVPGVLDVAPTPRGRDLGVFISHASEDRAIAERIAMGLQAFGHRSWYAEWELEPGDSIVTKIETALAESDTLLVILSVRSVTSQWVRRELNTALMAQLSRGHGIEVIPVIIEDCEIPELLRETSYVDLRANFEDGLLKLLDKLRRRKQSMI